MDGMGQHPAFQVVAEFGQICQQSSHVIPCNPRKVSRWHTAAALVQIGTFSALQDPHEQGGNEVPRGLANTCSWEKSVREVQFQQTFSTNWLLVNMITPKLLGKNDQVRDLSATRAT